MPLKQHCGRISPALIHSINIGTALRKCNTIIIQMSLQLYHQRDKTGRRLECGMVRLLLLQPLFPFVYHLLTSSPWLRCTWSHPPTPTQGIVLGTWQHDHKCSTLPIPLHQPAKYPSGYLVSTVAENKGFVTFLEPSLLGLLVPGPSGSLSHIPPLSSLRYVWLSRLVPPQIKIVFVGYMWDLGLLWDYRFFQFPILVTTLTNQNSQNGTCI